MYTAGMKVLLTASLFLLAVIGTVLAIYLTPLKHLNAVEPSIRNIDPQEIYNRMLADPDRYIFIDVRQPGDYAKVHALNSINVPLQQIYYQRYKLPKKEKEIVLICSLAVASGIAYSYLEHYGFLNLYRIEGGIEQWVKAGLPTEMGT